MDWESRAYQQEAIRTCANAFAEGLSSVMLEAPVGSGKTYMGLEVARILGERAGRPLRVDWVAPRRHLLRQVMEANRDLHRLPVRPVSLFEKLPPPADLVVLDEAHHEATQSCVLLYEKIRAPLVLGLSATPLRTDRVKLSFQRTVTTCGIARLVREGYLSPIHSYLLPHWGPRIVAECYLSDPARWGKSLVFFATVAECGLFREALAAGGVRCEVVTAESDRDAQLARFVSGETRVVANVAVLSEGFDLPDVGTVFARDASRLPTIQMCGRGLRLAEGKDHCNIVQSSGSPYLFERVTPALRAFRLHDGQWLALQDRTRSIEETLRRSLELLERREDERTRRQRPASGRSRRGTDPADAGRDTPVDAETRRAYQLFYGLYELCNELGWGGALPPCRLSFNRSPKPSRVAGFTQPGRPYPRISLNLRICAAYNTASILPVLFHEMVHVWQFSNGRRGGHGPDFRNELLRIGISEGSMIVLPGTPAMRAIRSAESTHPEAAALFRSLIGRPDAGQRAVEEAIFREYILARSRRNRP